MHSQTLVSSMHPELLGSTAVGRAADGGSKGVDPSTRVQVWTMARQPSDGA
jgi:hypothetical protein